MKSTLEIRNDLLSKCDCPVDHKQIDIYTAGRNKAFRVTCKNCLLTFQSEHYGD